MTKKDYVMIAAVIKEMQSLQAAQKNSDVRAGIDFTALRLSEVFEGDNRQFNRHRFLRACGIPAVAGLERVV